MLTRKLALEAGEVARDFGWRLGLDEQAGDELHGLVVGLLIDRYEQRWPQGLVSGAQHAALKDGFDKLRETSDARAQRAYDKGCADFRRECVRLAAERDEMAAELERTGRESRSGLARLFIAEGEVSA